MAVLTRPRRPAEASGPGGMHQPLALPTHGPFGLVGPAKELPLVTPQL